MGDLEDFEDEFGEEPLPSSAVSTKQRLAGLKAARRYQGIALTQPKFKLQLNSEKAWDAPHHKRRDA